MGNERISQIKKSAGISAKVMNVFAVITRVGAIISIVGAIICLISMGFTDKEGIIYQGEKTRIIVPTAQDFDMTGGFEIIQKLNIENPMLWAAANCFAAVIVLALLSAVFIVIRNVFKEIAESDTPFTESIMKRLKIAGIIVTIFVLQSSLAAAVLTALTFWCVYSVFGYGMELQKNEDETL